jgi:hypothetical protein
MREARHRFELELELIMRRAVASAFCVGLLALPFGAAADDAPAPSPASEHPTSTTQSKSDAAAKPPTAGRHDPVGGNAAVGPVAITAKRTHPRLDLRLSSDRLNRVLNESGVEPVAETDSAVDTVEVTAHHVQQEPIAQGIPALYYGITHPTEAWRIFAPIQP